MAKSYEELEFTDNFMFVKIMSSRPDLCAELLELILQKKISRLEPVTYENSFQPTYESKGIRLDVYVEDDEHTRYDVEMQVEPDMNLAKRSRYYHSAMDMEMLLKGSSYADLKQSYVIFICKNGIPGRVNRPISTYKNRCVESPEEYLEDGTCTVFVNADATGGEISTEMQEFLEFIRTGKSYGSANSLTGRIHRAVAEAVRTGEWSVEYMWAEIEMNKRYLKGKEEGIKEGLEAGRQEGREEGRQEERKNTEAALKRADELSAEVARLKAELEALKNA